MLRYGNLVLKKQQKLAVWTNAEKEKEERTDQEGN